jgi:beta-galactosidase
MMIQIKYCVMLLLASLTSLALGQQSISVPQIGAEVWLDSTDTPEQIDGWFRVMAEEHMHVARIWIGWHAVEPTPGQWDFALFDEAFRAANKYHVRIAATLEAGGSPYLPNYSSKYPASEEVQKAAAEYIGQVVDHYKQNPALDSWILVNEPGVAPAATPLSITLFQNWLSHHYSRIEDLNTSWHTGYKSFQDVTPPSNEGLPNFNSQTDWLDFWRTYQTGQIQWLEQQVRKHDPNLSHRTNVNPHALLSNMAAHSDNLAAWRPFLDTLGCEVHPEWHFRILKRDQYALGASYSNDLVAGAIEPKPHWVTEMQAGTIVNGVPVPGEPTADDIAQWIWTSIGAGAERVIFWRLNQRLDGIEALNTTLLNFQQKPSQRLEAAGAIARTLDSHAEVFRGAHVMETPITVIMSLDTETLEEQYFSTDYPGRGKDADLLAALGMYQAISQIGEPPRVKLIEDYDWRAKTPTPRVAILPDLRVLTAGQFDDLEAFVENGNTLLITGLTGLFDKHAQPWPYLGYPLGKITGADLKEVMFIGGDVNLHLNSPQTTLPSHLWIGTIDNHSAQVAGERDGEVVATTRTTKNGGKVFWIPSPIGIGGWLRGTEPLAVYLKDALGPEIASEPFRFPKPQNGCLMRVLKSGSSYLTVVTNGGSTPVDCEVEHPSNFRLETVWGQAPETQGPVATFHLAGRGTSVTLWR